MSHQYEYPYLPPAKNGLFRSLSVKNFRLYFVGHFISMVGVWMQIVALSWLVWRLTGSADWLGIVGFSSRFMTFVLGLIGGVAVDRILRRNLILFTQFLSMLQAFALAILTFLETITPEIIIVLALFLGAVYAFDFPARQSFIMDMVGKDYVDNAIAISSSVVHLARVIGPAAAGFVVAYFGEGVCFVINAVSFLALIIALFLIDGSKLNIQPMHDLSVHKAIKEGLSTAWKDRDLKLPLILLSIISFFLMPYYILIPMFVSDVYGGGSEYYGFLMAASAAGSLIGGLIMAKSGPEMTKKNAKTTTLLLSTAIAVFAWMPNFTLGLIAMFFVGTFALISLASINAWLQRQSPDHMRGMIMALYTIMFFGVTPFGSLIAGFAAERIGPQTTLTAGGIACVILSLLLNKISKASLKN